MVNSIWSFNFSTSPSNEYSGLISFRIDWFDLLAIQGTFKILLQHRSLKAVYPACVWTLQAWEEALLCEIQQSLHSLMLSELLLEASSRRDSRMACPIAKTKITQLRAAQLSVKKPHAGISREHCCDDLCVCSVTQSCPTLFNPMGCSLPGSSVHGILQARILEWVAISFSRGSSPSRD